MVVLSDFDTGSHSVTRACFEFIDPSASASHVPSITRVSPMPDISYISEGMDVD